VLLLSMEYSGIQSRYRSVKFETLGAAILVGLGVAVPALAPLIVGVLSGRYQGEVV